MTARLLIGFLATWLVAISGWAQGTVVFNTRLLAVGLDAPVMGPDWASLAPAWSAGLYYNGVLVPGSVTTFRDGSVNPQLARYIVGLTVAIPGTLIGQKDVPVQMRAWLTASGSFEAAKPSFRLGSSDLIVAELGGGPDPSVANHLPASFTGIVYYRPEPSAIALGAIGALAFLTRRFFARPSA